MSPDAAYVIEQPHLVPLPDVLPPVYELLERVVDLHGYVSVDTNCYSVPERYVGKPVTVTKTPAQVEVRHKSTTIATHRPRHRGETNLAGDRHKFGWRIARVGP